MIKQTATTVKPCRIFNKDVLSCSGTDFATVFADSGTNIITVGSGFTGMIRLFEVYDYPKIYISTAT